MGYNEGRKSSNTTLCIQGVHLMKNTLESATARAQTPFQNQPFIDFSKEENRKAQIEALEQVKSELGRKYPLIIGGEKIMNEDTFTPSILRNPTRSLAIFHAP